MTDVQLPAVGKVKREYLFAGGALIVGIVGYAWWAKSRSGASELAVTPEDVGATDYVNPQTYRDSTQAVDATGKSPEDIDTNAEWTQKAVELLASVGFDAMMVTTALGKYLNRQGLTTTEKGAVIAARGMVGDPPVGGPYPILDALPTPKPSPDPHPTPQPKPTPPPWHGPLRRRAAGTTTRTIRTLSGGRRTWAQLLPMFYNNAPPAGSAQARAAGEILRHANDWRNNVPPGKRAPDGAGKWETVGSLVNVSVPAIINV